MLRVGIIGLGGMGRGRLSYYAKIPEAQVVAVADIRSEQLRHDSSLASLFEIPVQEVRWFQDYRELVTSGMVDMVDICLPTSAHKEAVIASLRAGVHSLCEKPMALTLKDSQAMLAESQANGKLLMIAHCVRFWPEYEYLAQLVRNGKVGRLLSLHLSRQGLTPGKQWMRSNEQSGGVIFDLHVHDLDFCQYLLGLPRRIYAQGNQNRGALFNYDYVSTNLDYGPGLQVSATAHWTTARIPFTARYEAHFERAFLFYDSTQRPTLRVYYADKEEPECPELPPSRTAYLNEIRYFIQCILQQDSPQRCPPEESCETVNLCLKTLDSLKTGQLSPIEPIYTANG
ncbi:MAG: Gfo/Idh/MocA family oxidoreductase [Anaerolineae bacterium]|nr:Gfo/Idh/MocA family oxidoreductase [Anaerolineae bacterium]